MNVIARLGYELAHYDSAVHRFNHYTTRIPYHLKECLDPCFNCTFICTEPITVNNRKFVYFCHTQNTFSSSIQLTIYPNYFPVSDVVRIITFFCVHFLSLSLSIYIYIYIYRERERERDERCQNNLCKSVNLDNLIMGISLARSPSVWRLREGTWYSDDRRQCSV